MGDICVYSIILSITQQDLCVLDQRASVVTSDIKHERFDVTSTSLNDVTLMMYCAM